MGILSSLVVADVKSTTRKSYNYQPMYNYHYSYSRVTTINNYAARYFEIKKEHKKVVNLLDNANKTINDLKLRINNLKKSNKFWREKVKGNNNPIAKAKRTQAIKRMREQIKINK